MIERIAQDRTADRLQFGRDLADPDRIGGLQRQLCDLGTDASQLPDREPGERRTKQQQRAKAAIEPAANSEVERRHGPVLAIAMFKADG